MLALALLAAVNGALTRSPPAPNPKTLVVLPALAQKQTYQTFFKTLKGRGHSLEFKECKDKSIKLVSYGVKKYDNAIIFCPKQKTVGELNHNKLVQFTDLGGNVLAGLSNAASDLWRKFAMSNGMKLHPKNARVGDHFHRAAGHPGSVLTGNWVPLLGPGYSAAAPVLFDTQSGIALSARKNAHWVVSLLSGSSTSFSGSANHHESLDGNTAEASGRDVMLVAALEGKNGGRVTMAGSVELFSDSSFNTPGPITDLSTQKSWPKTANRGFATALGEWACGERGYLRVINRTHRQSKKGQDVVVNPTTYRIADDVEYRFELQEYRNGGWVPFEADDVEFEFVRLDPFVRMLATHEGGGKYVVPFQVPDTFGVYKFSVQYNRRGYTTLHFFDTVSVRPFAHDEYGRFLGAAMPYYAGALSSLGAFVSFSWIFLHHAKEGGKKKD